MKLLVKLLSRTGEHVATLSEQTRLRIAVTGVLVLLGCGGYKFYRSINKLYAPPANVTPAQFIKPMEKLYSQTKAETIDYIYRRKFTIAQLDSLSRLTNKSTKR